MPRLNRYVNRDGFYVTNLFADGSKIKKVTYQVHPRAEAVFESAGVKSGDEIPLKLFFDLVRDHLLYTHHGGAGDEDREEGGRSRTVKYVSQAQRRQIPVDLATDLITNSGELISFGAFVVKFGGAGGYDLDTLRRAYSAKQQQFERARSLGIVTTGSAPKIQQHEVSPARAQSIDNSSGARVVSRLGDRFDRAVVYASTIHAGQLRKGANISYVAHLLGVASIALEFGANEDEAIGALLHDAAEDAGGAGRIADIRRRFGDKVARIVEGCTDTVQVPKPPWLQRKEEYIAHLASADASTLLVSASDKLHNAQSILRDLRQCGDALWSRFTGGKEGSLHYYRALVTAFRRNPGSNAALIEEFDRVVSEIERLAG
jgi:HD domain